MSVCREHTTRAGWCASCQLDNIEALLERIASSLERIADALAKSGASPEDIRHEEHLAIERAEREWLGHPDVPTGARNGLIRAGITPDMAARLTDNELRYRRGVGDVAVAAIRRAVGYVR